MRIERDYGAGGVQVAHEYGYNSDGARVWKRDRRDMQNEQEYRYVCGIGCGGVPMRVYNRPMNGGSWTSVEDYLDTDSALGYGYNWQYRHSGGELLMMTASGEPSAYYPMDSNGLAVQNAPAQPCVCPVAPVRTAACSPLGYGGCCENYLTFTTHSEYYYSHQPHTGYGNVVLPQVAWIPIICIGACACGAFCLTYLFSCMRDCSSAMNLTDCLQTCIGALPGWVQFLCGVCLIGCLLCIQGALCPPSRALECHLHCLGRGYVGFCVFGICICSPIRPFPRPIPPGKEPC